MAVSPRFTTIEGVVDGITAVRENAAMGLVVDRSSCGPLIPSRIVPSLTRKALTAA
ncbi:hypothetical protein [Pseudarthrobacter sp. S9]|uniref:hypothetical protein n=1 Tax=Pseudarthrobacter sp. S9 TaxID=3418421 RepID=UPI003D0094EE